MIDIKDTLKGAAIVTAVAFGVAYLADPMSRDMAELVAAEQTGLQSFCEQHGQRGEWRCEHIDPPRIVWVRQ